MNLKVNSIPSYILWLSSYNTFNSYWSTLCVSTSIIVINQIEILKLGVILKSYSNTTFLQEKQGQERINDQPMAAYLLIIDLCLWVHWFLLSSFVLILEATIADPGY